MTRGECAARRDASPLTALDRTRTNSWSLELVTATPPILDGPDDEALFLLLGVPPGAFTTSGLVTPGEELSVLSTLGMAHWTDPDDILVVPRIDAVHAVLGKGHAHLLLGGDSWISRPIGSREETIGRRRASCQFGVYFHHGQAPARAHVYDVFDEQLVAGRSAVAEIRVEHS